MTAKSTYIDPQSGPQVESYDSDFEEEVLAVVTLKPDAQLAPSHLLEFLVPRMPYFMVPRFVRFVDELPKTPTLKIEKHLLRQHGLAAPGVWDREAAGFKLGRNS